jgi:hypothetical protein
MSPDDPQPDDLKRQLDDAFYRLGYERGKEEGERIAAVLFGPPEQRQLDLILDSMAR